ncbi:hypothetical protein Tco_0189423 [Tanacetum coccineum]
MSVPITAEEKTNKKNDVKARSLLLMALPNEHQLTFSQYNDAKTIASSTESLDSIFNRLKKIVSKLAILGVVISQEDLNSNFLSSLPPEWNTHVVVWMNKDEIETMSINDLYNNFKIIEQNVGERKPSKDLDKLLGSQVTDKSKKGLGYNALPPPHPLIYNRPKKIDLSYSGLDEFKEPEFKNYGSENIKQESNIVCDKKLDESKENSDDSLVKEQVSKDTSSFVESPLNIDKETIFLEKKIGKSKKLEWIEVQSELVKMKYSDVGVDQGLCFICVEFLITVQANCK